MDQMLPFIQNVGAPIAIAFYVLWQTTNAVNGLRDEVHQMNENLVKLITQKGG